MTGKTHATCSAAAVAVYALSAPHYTQVFGTEIIPTIGLIVVPIAALLPDIDIQQSRLGKMFGVVSKNIKHRGITHTLLVPVILAISIAMLYSRSAGIIASLLVGWLTGMMFDKGGGKKTILKSLLGAVGGKIGVATICVLLLLTITIPATTASIMWGLCVGWSLHVFEDLFNRKGCPILWPVSKKHIHIACFKTRHWSEGLFLMLWLGGCLLWALRVVDGESIRASLQFL